jgi:hypothetical protein
MTVFFCASSNCSHRHVSGIGMSLKLRFSWGMALLVCTRCYWHIGDTPKESIHEVADAEQILDRPDELRGLRTAGCDVRPFCWDQRLTSVRQNENKLQAPAHARMPEYLQRLSLKWMMWTSDGHSFREVPMMGSVWWFPLTKSITTF